MYFAFSIEVAWTRRNRDERKKGKGNNEVIIWYVLIKQIIIGIDIFFKKIELYIQIFYIYIYIYIYSHIDWGGDEQMWTKYSLVGFGPNRWSSYETYV